MRFELDGACMTDRAAAHDHLQQVLALPAYYGRNLDALYDLLTEDGKEKTIVVYHSDKMQRSLGGYAVALIETLHQATEANPVLTVVIEE